MSDDGDGDGAADATVLAFEPPEIVATKTSSIPQANVGETITFTITLEHLAGGGVAGIEIVDQMPDGLSYVAGTATVGGTPTEPTITGNELIWSGISMATGTTIAVIFEALVEPSAPEGGIENIAFMRSPATGEVISNIARVIVEKEPIYVFECADIIGRVFDDRNLNGVPNEGEPGIKGAHLYTIKGMRITTDAHGRYHVPCPELPDREGTNYILKLDERSLPAGFHITSDNPRVQRLTKGKMVQFNFGAAKARLVNINVNSAAFAADDASPSDALRRGLRSLVGHLDGRPTVLRVDYVRSGEPKSLVKSRLMQIERTVRASLPAAAQDRLRIDTHIASQ